MAKSLEEPSFELIKKFHDFEIRKYTSNIQASVRSQGAGDLVNRGSFQRIAGYIFGGNSSNQRIAMTAPVMMWQDDGASMMSFVMPSAYALDDLPVPDDAGLQLVVNEEEIVAAFHFVDFLGQTKLHDSQNTFNHSSTRKAGNKLALHVLLCMTLRRPCRSFDATKL